MRELKQVALREHLVCFRNSNRIAACKLDATMGPIYVDLITCKRNSSFDETLDGAEQAVLQPRLVRAAYLAMVYHNSCFRRLNTQNVPTTGGIPDYYLSSVRMFRAAFPNGFAIDSPDYTAVCVFLDHEDYPHRAIAQILDFSFDHGYVNVLNALGFIENNEVRAREIARIEELLRPHGLEAWRNEDEYGRPREAR